jgi:hypothetical protein
LKRSKKKKKEKHHGDSSWPSFFLARGLCSRNRATNPSWPRRHSSLPSPQWQVQCKGQRQVASPVQQLFRTWAQDYITKMPSEWGKKEVLLLFHTSISDFNFKLYFQTLISDFNFRF